MKAAKKEEDLTMAEGSREGTDGPQLPPGVAAVERYALFPGEEYTHDRPGPAGLVQVTVAAVVLCPGAMRRFVRREIAAAANCPSPN